MLLQPGAASIFAHTADYRSYIFGKLLPPVPDFLQHGSPLAQIYFLAAITTLTGTWRLSCAGHDMAFKQRLLQAAPSSSGAHRV
jgi:hypothetical protein